MKHGRMVVVEVVEQAHGSQRQSAGTKVIAAGRTSQLPVKLAPNGIRAALARYDAKFLC